ncbi:hypothetical protein HPSA50_0661 [Helicobacter pylori SouthAfrica50]|uniref:Uncharacterized protein n=1 Tax=Helicobacter pylori SouthAfrica50 TaxID=1352357 RepID=T2S6N9_HELPX|nr:hypothetical protein HPSA50_0661 [Helicobacter pylori SouthAfrica50]
MANWWGGAKEFKKSVLYFILSRCYKIAIHENPNKPTDLVFGSPVGEARKILSYQNTKRVFYTGRLLQNASPLLELSQTISFKIYHKIYQKTLPLLCAARKLIKK